MCVCGAICSSIIPNFFVENSQRIFSLNQYIEWCSRSFGNMKFSKNWKCKYYFPSFLSILSIKNIYITL